MTKSEIINKFLEDKSESSACLNPDIFQTNFKEVSEMFELVKESLESSVSWNDFLKLENAINNKGHVITDRLVSYYDKEKKQNVSVKVIFKYPVFNWLRKQIENNEEYAQGVAWESIPTTDKNYLTNFAKGLKTGKPEKIKNILTAARQKFIQHE